LGIKKVDGDDEENMLWHYYVWKETLLPGSTNTQLKRATADVLLYGPTSLDQIQVQVVGKKRVKLEYTPFSVLYNSRRTALQTASSFSAQAIQIADYIHNNADFRKAGRTVTILHLLPPSRGGPTGPF
jgi:hypothetical protein